MSNYIISPSASRDLNDIADYFLARNLEAGEKLFREFNKKCQNLANFPSMGLKPISSVYSSFLYLYFSSIETLEMMAQKASGTSQRFFSLQFLRSLEIISPPANILLNFDSIVSPILKQRSLLHKKNQNLRQTRNLLLPKLISGEIDVEHLDITTEDIAA